MTKTFDILAFAEENSVAVRKIASDFRPAGVTEACVLATIAIAASGRTFSLAAAGAGGKIAKPASWLFAAARKILERELRPTAFASLDAENDDGVALTECLAAPAPEINVWQRADAHGMHVLCDVLEGGTAALAKRLGVTRRRAQQKFVEAAAAARAGRQNDLFCGAAK